MNQHIDDRHCRLPDRRSALVRNTDVMADVLAFLPRKMIALRLAVVNVAFSALCNCWCQPEEVEADEADAESVDSALSAFGNGQQRKRKWSQGSKSKK